MAEAAAAAPLQPPEGARRWGEVAWGVPGGALGGPGWQPPSPAVPLARLLLAQAAHRRQDLSFAQHLWLSSYLRRLVSRGAGINAVLCVHQFERLHEAL